MCSEAPTEPAGETSPESVHAHKRRGLGLWLTQSDARYLCGQRRRADFRVAAVLPYLSLFAEKKILCLPPPFWIQFLSFDFGHTKKPLHHITKDKRIFLSDFAMLCNGFEIQNPCCILPAEKAAYFRRRSALYHRLTSKRIAYVIFNFL